MYKTIDVEIDLEDFDTWDLIEELKLRAKSGDKEANAALGAKEPDPNQTDFIRSAAEVLSNAYILDELIKPTEVINAQGVGVMAVENAKQTKAMP